MSTARWSSAGADRQWRAVTRIAIAGNVTEDLTKEGTWSPGGPALYAARTCAALGAEVDLITRVSEEYDTHVLEGLIVHQLPARFACRYANRYDESGARTQLLLDPCAPLDPAAIQSVAAAAGALLLAPAFHELAGPPPPADSQLRAVALQGVLRAVEGQRVVAHPNPLGQARELVAAGTWAFLSAEDTPEPERLAKQLAADGARVWLTRAHRGATLFAGSAGRSFNAIPADAVVDPTGAGDCFAAAFVVRLFETDDVAEAARFALAAGSLAVEGVGIAGIPARAAIERRLEREAA